MTAFKVDGTSGTIKVTSTMVHCAPSSLLPGRRRKYKPIRCGGSGGDDWLRCLACCPLCCSSQVKTSRYVKQQKAGPDAKPVTRLAWTQVQPQTVDRPSSVPALALARHLRALCHRRTRRLGGANSRPAARRVHNLLPLVVAPQASPWWRNLGRFPANAANTSMLMWRGKLYALCEVGDAVQWWCPSQHVVSLPRPAA